MSKPSRFVYVTYIRTTPAKLWQALTDPSIIRQYWFDLTIAYEIDGPESRFIAALSVGLPLVFSNLKSLLETGEVMFRAYSGH